MKPNLGEKMVSGAGDPRLRNEAALFESLRIVVQMVEDVIEDFWWEVWISHRGFGPER